MIVHVAEPLIAETDVDVTVMDEGQVEVVGDVTNGANHELLYNVG